VIKLPNDQNKELGDELRGKTMSKIFPIMMILCICIGACGGKKDYSVKFNPSERITVGVLDFTRFSDNESLEQYRRGLTDMFIAALDEIPELYVVERSQLDKVMSEFELGELGVIDPETAQKIGRALGAQALYFGSFTEFQNIIRLSGKLIRVETAAVLSGGQYTSEVDGEKVFKMVDKVSEIIAAKVKANHKLLIADSFYAKGRTAEEENDKSNAIINYQKALQYYPKHEDSQKALKRLQQ
jgi:TolB-like protein